MEPFKPQCFGELFEKLPIAVVYAAVGIKVGNPVICNAELSTTLNISICEENRSAISRAESKAFFDNSEPSIATNIFLYKFSPL